MKTSELECDADSLQDSLLCRKFEPISFVESRRIYDDDDKLVARWNNPMIALYFFFVTTTLRVATCRSVVTTKSAVPEKRNRTLSLDFCNGQYYCLRMLGAAVSFLFSGDWGPVVFLPFHAVKTDTHKSAERRVQATTRVFQHSLATNGNGMGLCCAATAQMSICEAVKGCMETWKSLIRIFYPWGWQLFCTQNSILARHL